MKILEVVRGLRKSSGVATFVREVADALYSSGVDVAIAMNRPGKENWMPPSGKEPVVGLRDAVACGTKWDIVHVHGLWDAEIRQAAKWAVGHDVPLVWSPHGMLAPWALSYHWYRKLLPWHLYTKRLLHKATVFHATATNEAEWIHKAGFDNEVEIVPLGTHLPDLSCAAANRIGSGIRRLLFVGRVHPVKGLENLIRAWAMCDTVGWELRIVGPDSGGYEKRLKELAEDLGCSEGIRFAGQKLGADLAREYLDCDCLVLPSFSENFGGVVIDAMAAGKPVIASRSTPWSELEGDDTHVIIDASSQHRCGWWIDNDPASLSSAISAMMALDDGERLSVGGNGRLLVERKYTWPTVAQQMAKVYNRLIEF